MSAEQSTRSPIPGEESSPIAAEAQAGRQAVASPAPGRFGVRLAGMPVVFPAGEMLEYLPQVTVWRMPLAPLRVAGLMQLRGHPVPVFDAGRRQGDEAPARASVLVVGDAARAAALAVDSAPESVELADLGHDAGDRSRAEGEREAVSGDDDIDRDREAGSGLDEALDELAASVCFRAALGEPLSDRSGQRWWPVSPALLFECLAGEARHD